MIIIATYMETNLQSSGIQIMGFLLKKEVAVGDLLTSFTILASFIGWLIATTTKNSEKKRDENKSGALRFLLKLLREKENKVFTFDELKVEFESVTRKEERQLYCGKNFKYKSQSEFEAAIYRLDWEMKIEFITTNEIKFKVDRKSNPSLISTFKELGNDKMKEILIELLDKIKNNQILNYNEERAIESLNYIFPKEIKESLIQLIDTSEGESRLTAVKLLTQISEP